MSPIARRPFMARVEPVETRSTIASARPSRGATSTAPDSEMTSTGMPWSAKNRRVTLGCEVAIRTPARSAMASYGRVGGHGGDEPAAPVAQLAEHRKVDAALGQDVAARDARVGDAVVDELDDVAGPHEQDVERVVLDARDEAPVVLLEDQAGVVEQAEGGLEEAALVRDGEAEALPHRSVPSG